MILRKIIALSAVLTAIGAFAGGCQSGGVGDPCTPEDEYQPSFSGFAASEVNIESRSFQCQTRVCLVNHFRGRVSCPLGQTAGQGALGNLYTEVKAGRLSHDDAVAQATAQGLDFDAYKPTAGDVCRIPGSSGSQAEVVQTSVLPQCTTRKASNVVYCSCRCDGDDKNAKYCECPSGFSCKKFPELDLGAAVSGGSGNLSGSYCVKNDNNVDFTQGECPQAVSADSLSDACTNKGECENVKANP